MVKDLCAKIGHPDLVEIRVRECDIYAIPGLLDGNSDFLSDVAGRFFDEREKLLFQYVAHHPLAKTTLKWFGLSVDLGFVTLADADLPGRKSPITVSFDGLHQLDMRNLAVTDRADINLCFLR
jgi:hypothetical protein